MIWWDPVGAYGVAEATDEYDWYVGLVGRALREGGREAEIAGLLDQSHSEMGITADSKAPP